MYLVYNNLELKLLTLDRVDRETVWTSDGVDVLYVRWKISASCVYAPGNYQHGVSMSRALRVPAGRTNFVGISPADPNPQTDQGNTESLLFAKKPPIQGPIVTDVALRTILFRNRKKLIIGGDNPTIGTQNIWLESPVDPATCDADNGPKVHACNVVSATGAPGNFGVQLEIETCLPPTPDGSDRAILGHRWQMSHTHDEDYYLTRTVTGEATFHPGLMDHYAKNPDWFRAQLFHPIPIGFRRTLGPITLSPDGCVLQYQYSDTDPTIMFCPGTSGATNIDVKEEYTVTSPNPLTAIGLATGGR